MFLGLAAAIIRAAGAPPEIHPIGKDFQVTLSEPVVISLAPQGERRWGRHQFVNISPYPGGKLLLRFHAGEDSVRAYGSGQPTFISADHGRSWAPFEARDLPDSGLVCELRNGQSLCMPMPKPLNIAAEGVQLPLPSGELFTYRRMLLYPADKCPEKVQNHLRSQPARRWAPDQGKWMADTVAFDMQDRVVWIAQGSEAGLVSGTSFERAPIQVGTELLWADYRSVYLMPDGSAPKGFGVSCMASTDNGKSWRRRAPIVNADAIAGEISSMTEPVLEQNAKGDIICVIRRADQKQKSMLITFSRDKGKTWDKPRALEELGNFGVMPDLARLESGPLVLSYGRPGVNLTFSLDGLGTAWEAPLSVIAGDPQNASAKTDGYTSLVPLGGSEFLIGYTHFDHVDDKGEKRKAILVRKVTLERTR